MPPMTGRRSSSVAPPLSRSSHRVPQLARIGSSAEQTETPSRPSYRRAISAELRRSVSTVEGPVPHADRPHRIRPSSAACFRRVVSTEQPQPGGTSPGAMSASGARTNSRIAAAGCGTSRSRGAFEASTPASTDRAPSARSTDDPVPPEDQQIEVDLSRPPATPRLAAEAALESFQLSRTSSAPVAGPASGRNVEGCDSVPELGLIRSHGAVAYSRDTLRRLIPGAASASTAVGKRRLGVPQVGPEADIGANTFGGHGPPVGGG